MQLYIIEQEYGYNYEEKCYKHLFYLSEDNAKKNFSKLKEDYQNYKEEMKKLNPRFKKMNDEEIEKIEEQLKTKYENYKFYQMDTYEVILKTDFTQD